MQSISTNVSYTHIPLIRGFHRWIKITTHIICINILIRGSIVRLMDNGLWPLMAKIRVSEMIRQLPSMVLQILKYST